MVIPAAGLPACAAAVYGPSGLAVTIFCGWYPGLGCWYSPAWSGLAAACWYSGAARSGLPTGWYCAARYRCSAAYLACSELRYMLIMEPRSEEAGCGGGGGAAGAYSRFTPAAGAVGGVSERRLAGEWEGRLLDGVGSPPGRPL